MNRGATCFSDSRHGGGWRLALLCAVSVMMGCHSSGRGDPRAQLERSASGPTTLTENESGRVTHISTNVAVSGSTLAEQADAFLATYGALLIDDVSRLQQREMIPDERGSGGVLVYGVEQEGRPVYGAEVRVAVDGAGHVHYASGSLPSSFDDLGPATVDEARARQVVRDAYPDSTLRGVGALVIFNRGLFNVVATPSHLAWMIDVSDLSVDGSQRVFVDAQTADLLIAIPRNVTERDRDIRSYAGVVDAGPGVDADAGVDPDAGVDAGAGATESPVPQYDESGVLSGVTPTADATAAYSHAGAVYDFYSESFDRDSVDGAGLSLRLDMDYPESSMGAQNAFWSQDEHQMVFTPGLATLDITAHELTHGVVEFTAGLEYVDESGALNESMADTFAAFIDTTGPWTMGEDSSLGTIRSFIEPGTYGQPDHVSQQYRPSPTCAGEDCDSGGVHINSGIPNRIVYLFTEGGTHEVSGISVTGMGMERSKHVVYEALRRYLGASSTFLDYRSAARQAIWDFLEGAEWTPSLGFGYTYRQCGALLNAFAAAGVGPEDHDDDCFDDETDNCPCVYNPTQKPEDCSSDADRSCLAPECGTDASCGEGRTCGPAGRCVAPTSAPGACTSPADCPGNVDCYSDLTCAPADCTSFADCDSCSAVSDCGWCPGSGSCAFQVLADLCGGGLAATCPSSSTCAGTGTETCEGCNSELGCGWCEGVGCIADGDAGSCMGTFRDSPSMCAPCGGYTDCASCATDGFCSWCAGSGCMIDSTARATCGMPAVNPGECG